MELREARAYATAVSMADGSMWIMGGMGVNGSVCRSEDVIINNGSLLVPTDH